MCNVPMLNVVLLFFELTPKWPYAYCKFDASPNFPYPYYIINKMIVEAVIKRVNYQLVL